MPPHPPGDPLGTVPRLRRWSAEARRSFAVAAARERDGERLWELTAAHLAPRADADGGRPATPVAHTLRAYRRGVLDLARAWPGDLLEPEAAAADRYAAALRTGGAASAAPGPGSGTTARRGRPPAPRGLADASVALRLAAARALFAALRWAGATDADPVPPSAPRAAAMRRAGRRTTRRTYGDGAVAAMLRAARDDDDRCIVLLGADAGLRVAAMLALRWEHVDTASRRLRVPTAAAGAAVGAGPADDEGQAVALSARAADALEHARTVAIASGRTSVLALRSQFGVYRRLQRLCRRAGVEFMGVDALRRTDRRNDGVVDGDR